jgi:glycolate oxidase iron-sulfur subunit
VSLASDGLDERVLACVHCGFCLPACPTYTRLGDEADSPRGRLYLIRAVAEGRLPADAPALATHLDRCLGCRACEPVCPVGVPYGALLERGRAVVRAAGTGQGHAGWLADLFGGPLGPLALGVARLLRWLGLARALARKLPARFSRLKLALGMLAASAGPRGAERRALPPPSPARLRVGLFSGCVQRGLFRRVNEATARVLWANGCEVVPLREVSCCGALHAHAGDLEGARRLARTNLELIEAAAVDRVVLDSAGCGAALKEYGELFGSDPRMQPRAQALAAKVRDISELLGELGPRPGAPLGVRACYDAPCHLQHAQRVAIQPLEVLRRAGVEVLALRGADECCGGAGTYGLAQPALAERLWRDKVAAVKEADPEVLVTANPGCMMQLGAGLMLEGDPRPVRHVVELLDESYRQAGLYPKG